MQRPVSACITQQTRSHLPGPNSFSHIQQPQPARVSSWLRFLNPINALIGASLSEPHIDELAVEFVYFIYYIYIYVSYVVP